jgi:SAM-dependent methyltransferase
VFWKQARRKYAGVTSDDPDVRRFLELSNSFQHDVYQGIGGWIQDEGHRWIARRTGRGMVLEIGFGAGRHSRFFGGECSSYFVSEYSAVHTNSAAWASVRGRALRCDARALPFRDASFDTAISAYNLEHIEDLQGVLREVSRVLRPAGKFLVALPCEGGLAWNLGRELTTRRTFRARYGVNYDKVIAYEHVRDLAGVLGEIRRSGCFDIDELVYLPLRLPSVHLNFVVCLACNLRRGQVAA